MQRFNRRHALGALGALTSLGQTSWAAGPYPQRPINVLVPFAAGGIADLTVRAVTQAMSGPLGQPIVIDNRPSAGSIVASQAVAGAPPDGHTVLLMSNGHAVAPHLFKKLGFDPQKDFAPVCVLGRFGLAAFVSASSSFTSLAQCVAHAKKNPGKLTVGSVAIGSTQHLSALLFLQRAGIEAVVVPYKSTPNLLGALRAGEVDLVFEILGPWLPQVVGGAVRALAVTSHDRDPELPQVPTVAEAGGPGLAGYAVQSWNGLAVPAKTPADVVARLNQVANEALAQPGVIKQLKALAVRTQGGTPEQMRQWLAAETKHWGDVVTTAKLEAS